MLTGVVDSVTHKAQARNDAITGRTMCIGDGERCASTFAQAAGNFRVFEYARAKVVGSFTMQIGCFVRPPSSDNSIGQKPASHCYSSHWCTQAFISRTSRGREQPLMLRIYRSSFRSSMRRTDRNLLRVRKRTCSTIYFLCHALDIHSWIDPSGNHSQLAPEQIRSLLSWVGRIRNLPTNDFLCTDGQLSYEQCGVHNRIEICFS
ncbi:hypothetical protein BD769DRAFT_986763 [Suillus cothurnatus]|nr:hypothetical protein BD769DRAFT_986763 [Suillus cothurnatus]